MGIDVSEDAGWLHNKGLRVIGGGMRLELDWPELACYPNYGLVRPRADLDHLLVQRAVKAGARLHEQTTVTGPVLDEQGRVVGVTAKSTAKDSAAQPSTYRAPIVLACDGVSGKFAQRLGCTATTNGRWAWRFGATTTSPRTNDDYLESWLELWDGPPGADDAKLLPGYGWIFGMGDGTVNVGLGVLNSSAGFQKTDYRTLLTSWLDSTPEEWGLREANAIGPTRGAGLPMGFNRTPHYSNGVLLVGDSGGSVNPFNGEGIPYAMESGKFAAEAVDSGAGPPGRPAARAGAARLSGGHDGRMGRLLPPRRRLREADRQPGGDAGLHPARLAPSGTDEVRAEIAGQSDRSARRRRHRPHHQRPDPDHPGGPLMTAGYQPRASKASLRTRAKCRGGLAWQRPWEHRAPLDVQSKQKGSRYSMLAHIPADRDPVRAGVRIRGLLGDHRARSPARSVTTRPSSTSTSAASSRRRCRPGRTGSRSSTS